MLYFLFNFELENKERMKADNNINNNNLYEIYNLNIKNCYFQRHIS